MDDGRIDEEAREQQASVLPAREAMSLISPESSSLTPALDAIAEAGGESMPEVPGEATAGAVAADTEQPGDDDHRLTASGDAAQQTSNERRPSAQT